jgi:DNA polymerase III delta prime subunit
MATAGPNSAQDDSTQHTIPSNPTPPQAKTSRRAGQRASQTGPHVGRIILLSGPPGAGKSTVAKELISTATAPTVYIEGDIFWSFIVKPHSPPKPRQATSRIVIKSMMLSALPYARAGYETIVDFTIGPWFLGLFKDYIKEIPFEYVILCPSEKVCAERNGSRKEGVMEEYPSDLHLAFSDINEFEKYAIRNDQASSKELAAQIRDGLARDVFKLDMKDLKEAS